MITISSLSLFFEAFFIFGFIDCQKRPMVWVVHPEVRHYFDILTSSLEIQRKSSIEGLTTDEKIELCESDVFLFISSQHPIPADMSISEESDEEEEEEEEKFHTPTEKDLASSSEPDKADKEDDFCSTKTSPGSEGETDSDSWTPILCDSEDEKKNGSEKSGETPPKDRKMSLKRARLISKTAWSMYPFNKAYDDFNPSVIFNIMEYVVVSVETKDYERKNQKQNSMMKSLPCFLNKAWSWFLANGYIKNTFFTIQRSKVTKKFTLTGLLDTVPIIDKLSTEELEETFVQGLNVAARNRTRRNICRLDEFSKFRLCSAAFVAWGLEHARDMITRWNFIIEKSKTECVKDVTITFLSVTVEETRAKIQSYLLPCYVNGDIYGPQFYLTADNVYRDAVYVVFAESSKRKGRRYVLDARLTNVTSLQMIKVVPLLETFNPYGEEDASEKERSPKKKRGRGKEKEPLLKKLMRSIVSKSQEGNGEDQQTFRRLLNRISFSSQASDDENQPMFKRFLRSISFKQGSDSDQPILKRLVKSISLNSQSNQTEGDKDQSIFNKFLRTINLKDQTGDGQEKSTLRKLMKNISFSNQTSNEEKPSLRKLLSGISFKRGPA